MIARPAASARRGLSLVEILVVIVILVAGILVFIQIFPIGFGSLRAAGVSTLADRMAQQQLNTLVANPNGVPDGIYTEYFTTTGQATVPYFDPTVSPTSLANYSLNSNPQFNNEMSDIDKTRYISNETFKIESGTATSGFGNTAIQGRNPMHVLNYGPIFIPAGTTLANLPNYIQTISADWTPTIADSSPAAISGAVTALPVNVPTDYVIPGQPTYVVDYTNERLAVAQEEYDQSFVFQVDTVTPAGLRQTQVVQFKLYGSTSTAGTPYAGNWFPKNGDTTDTIYEDPIITTGQVWPGTGSSGQYPSLPNANYNWIPGTARLYRVFNMLMTGSAFTTTDPYQCMLTEANYKNSDVNSGVLEFPANAAPSNGVTLTAKVSYSTFDWHILHEDRNVDAGASVQLTLDDLKKIGDTDQNGVLYTGLIPNIGAGNTNYDVLLLDLDSGMSLSYNDATTTNLDNGVDASGNIGVSYRNGRIQLPAGFSATHVRIFYATENDMGVSLQMAPLNYVQTTPQNVASTVFSQTPNRYALDTASPTIYFPPCDAGKQVRLTSITYTPQSTGNGPATPQTASEVDVILPPAASVPSQGVTLCSVPLGTYLAAADPTKTLPDPTKPCTVGPIIGLSANARAIWRDNGIWRVRTLTTTLGRS